MRAKSDPKKDSTPDINPQASWRVVEVNPLAGHRLKVRFVDELQGIVDLSELVFSDRAGVFAALQDTTLFKRAYIEHGAVTWPNGLDLAPDAMYDEIKRTGEWKL